ncbi:unnamed protein product [Caenorhabditis auriculariae]|uniref:Uncharacterized protein n=1 Tax=Caenorhabditis auriculariae TaxID=2777116 RepID=A0A8S1GQ72_9PELO|nr:unnamed protein product [Caenorhabditis auriculariae]
MKISSWTYETFHAILYRVSFIMVLFVKPILINNNSKRREEEDEREQMISGPFPGRFATFYDPVLRSRRCFSIVAVAF